MVRNIDQIEKVSLYVPRLISVKMSVRFIDGGKIRVRKNIL